MPLFQQFITRDSCPELAFVRLYVVTEARKSVIKP
jgi:hypothetical protein